ncbi:hypothetical protein ACFLY9_00735 [Patescibacteria group bacterium]
METEQAPFRTDWGPVIYGYRENEVTGIITNRHVDQEKGLLVYDLDIGGEPSQTVVMTFTMDEAARNYISVSGNQPPITLQRLRSGKYKVIPEALGVVTDIEVIDRNIRYMLITISTEHGFVRRAVLLHQMMGKGSLAVRDVVRIGTRSFFPHLRIVDNTPKETPAILEMFG